MRGTWDYFINQRVMQMKLNDIGVIYYKGPKNVHLCDHFVILLS